MISLTEPLPLLASIVMLIVSSDQNTEDLRSGLSQETKQEQAGRREVVAGSDSIYLCCQTKDCVTTLPIFHKVKLVSSKASNGIVLALTKTIFHVHLTLNTGMALNFL